ncbi:5-methyltetrahydrofolate--homocysteine methyltransferase [Acetitomaculum ruminis DSM 5522]|uniref:5-methyltetrahydrofolate--homocysteine methyltransferase n=1 Tax=Acetitomaculum ruminis DSM 5522 TaxID=1120918 RepID=A0A1I0V516_9FIRM|nr:homocysteine S-methyltransferase family protein [Acetitomaculum ruminis]SFA70646.1 5-methyltetrahydrofolate--homocysteine methyltransferase [Acetitomaculum ruminis DSM 5522]
MTLSEFYDLVNNHLVYLDGATGTQLYKNNMPKKVCVEKWVMDNSDVMKKIQRDYKNAGSEIVYAPTFGANRAFLKSHGFADEVDALNKGLVKITKEAIGDGVLVAGDLTMTGIGLEPMGDAELEELIEVYKEQIKSLVEAGVDLLIVETMISVAECRAAVIAAKEVTDLPVMVTLTFGKNNKTLYGSDPEAAVAVLQALGAAAIGINCSAGPKEIKGLVERMRKVATIPLIVKPNAGMPKYDEDGNAFYDQPIEEYVADMKDIVNAGADIIGGCCGTDERYIKALKDSIGSDKPHHTNYCVDQDFIRDKNYSTERCLVKMENLNSSSFKILQKDYKNPTKEEIHDAVIDSIDELLCTDFTDTEFLEQILRLNPGRAVFLSKGEEISPEIYSLLKKYGTLVY